MYSSASGLCAHWSALKAANWTAIASAHAKAHQPTEHGTYKPTYQPALESYCYVTYFAAIQPAIRDAKHVYQPSLVHPHSHIEPSRYSNTTSDKCYHWTHRLSNFKAHDRVSDGLHNCIEARRPSLYRSRCVCGQDQARQVQL